MASITAFKMESHSLKLFAFVIRELFALVKSIGSFAVPGWHSWLFCSAEPHMVLALGWSPTIIHLYLLGVDESI